MLIPFLGLAWLASFASVGAWHAPWWLMGLTILVLVPVGARLRGGLGAASVAAAAMLALAGGARFDFAHHTDTPGLLEAVPSARSVTLEGTIESDGKRGLTTTGYVLAVDAIDGTPTSGKVLLSLNQYEEHLPGDQVRAIGKLAAPPLFEGFDYRAYLAGQGIVATMYRPRIEQLGHVEPLTRWGARARHTFATALNRSLPEPESSLAAGIAFGQDETLPRDLKDAFRDSGLAHLTAVSGSNVSIVAGVAFLLVVPVFGRRFAIVPASLLVLSYVLLAGLSASVLRAAVMAFILLAGQWLGRPRSGLAALALAAIVMTAIDPLSAEDAGFQLSFAATAGIMIGQPWLVSLFDRAAGRWPLLAMIPRWAVGAASVSLPATIATLPVLWAVFGRVSLVSPAANIVAAPLFTLAFFVSGITAVAALLWEPAGWAAGVVAYYPLALLDWVAKAAAALPGAAIDVPALSAGNTVLLYAGAAIPLSFLYRRYAPERPRPEATPRASRVRLHLAGASAALGAVAIFQQGDVSWEEPGELVVSVLDVGQGDAILLTAPNGHRLLIDSGPSGLALVRELGALLPHWDRRVDSVLLTHPQEDHIAGFVELFRRFDVEVALETGVRNATLTDSLYIDEGPRFETVSRGSQWSEAGVSFEVIWPPAGYPTDDLNGTSIILQVSFGETTFLFTGDAEAPVLRQVMAARNLRADVLKVPHHGSKTTNSAFFEAVQPAIAVISVGAGNTFGHPSPETLTSLSANAGRTFRTDLDGRITIRSDGRRITFSTSK